MLSTFWKWYEKEYSVIVPLTALLFLLQLVHLYWMTADVVGLRLFGHEFWHIGKIGNIFISLVDYTEIPALILTSLFYIHELQKEFRQKSILFLILLNSQWLHLFWITDEIIVAQFTGAAPILLPIWLSWFAIIIDYLELPVIYDTTKKAIFSLRKPA